MTLSAVISTTQQASGLLNILRIGGCLTDYRQFRRLS